MQSREVLKIYRMEQRKALDTNLYTTPEIERIGRVAMDLARKRRNKVTSVEKANVMMSGAA